MAWKLNAAGKFNRAMVGVGGVMEAIMGLAFEWMVGAGVLEFVWEGKEWRGIHELEQFRGMYIYEVRREFSTVG